MRLEGLGKLKNPMTSSGIEPATFPTLCWSLAKFKNFTRSSILVRNTTRYTHLLFIGLFKDTISNAYVRDSESCYGRMLRLRRTCLYSEIVDLNGTVSIQLQD
jgi:hypothetical protein